MLNDERRIPSFEKINYSLRPAKNIERKMILESLYKLSNFSSIKDYTYIGFGSTYFTDFSLFHKQLGIDKLVSIELEEDYKERFEFNKPFHAINMIYGHSNESLKDSLINWSNRKIIWLDYDYQITADVIIDVDTVVNNCVSGDVFIITLNVATKEVYANPDKESSKEKAFGKFKKQLILDRGDDDKIDYSDLVTSSTVPSDLAGWGLANVCNKIIKKRIDDKIVERNQCNEDIVEYSMMNYKQIFNFHYQDGSMMMTVGFIFFNDIESAIYEKCKFEDYNYCNDLPFLIKAPNLTMKEIQYIDTFLPNNLENIDKKGIPESEINHYVKVYRYYPTFLEAFR